MPVYRAVSRFIDSTAELYRVQLHLLVSWREGRRALIGRLLSLLVVCASGNIALRTGAVDRRDPLAPFGRHAVDDLLRLDAMEHARTSS